MRVNYPASEQFPYMYHCHILEYEDRGVMGQLTMPPLISIREVLEDSWQVPRSVYKIDDYQLRRCVPIDNVVPTLLVVIEIIARIFTGDEEAAWPPVWRIAGCQGFQTIDELPFIATSLIDAKMLYGPKRNVS